MQFPELEVKCPPFQTSVSLKYLAYMSTNKNHNPRTGESPSSFLSNLCPNPKCDDISFSHDSVCAIYEFPSLEYEDARLTEMFIKVRPPGMPRYGLGYLEKMDELIPTC